MDARSGIMKPMNPTLPPLIRALLAPQRYPHPVQRVELAETHISWVLLAGELAYKIKKPLKLPFLDFSTLAQRRLSCADELRLNRRFAPDIYLDVIGIFGTPENPQWQGEGAPIEYAVKMRRFDEAGRLDRVCARRELQPSHLSALADTLAVFHDTAAIAAAASHFGQPQTIAAPARDNFDDLLRLLPHPGLQARLAAVRAWTETQLGQLAPLMRARQKAGRVRECHGDLHLANLVLTGERRVTMFDCIEFNDDLRWIDVASDIAFLYMDLLAHGEPGLANWWVNEALSRSGDYEAAPLLRFYAVYRAMVRAKVTAIHNAQRQDKTRDNDNEALAYLALAERLIAPPPVRLIITHGLSGSGKTVASSQLLQSDPQAATLRLRSDVERKRLFGLAGAARSGSAFNAGIYTPEARLRTYARLHTLAALLLRAHWSVIVDAAFLKQAERAAFRALAEKAGAAFAILAPQATPAQLRERIETRNALGHDASEATLAVLAQQLQTLEPLTADETRFVLGSAVGAQTGQTGYADTR